jgi:hypothetical protein
MRPLLIGQHRKSAAVQNSKKTGQEKELKQHE